MLEKKLKNAADKITMPESLKIRILRECENISAAENNEYEDNQVFVVEKAKPRYIRRIISGIAACAVLVGGIGLAGKSLRNSTEHFSEISDEEVSIDKASDTKPMSDAAGILSFSGFRTCPPYNESDDLLDETKSENMKNFFGSINWEEIDGTEYEVFQLPKVDCISISAPEDERECSVTISMDGSNIAQYTEVSAETDILTSKYYRIDEDEIRSGITTYILDYYNMYPPFGSIFKKTETLYCESEMYSGWLDFEDITTLSKMFLGWDWSNEEIVEDFLYVEIGQQAFAEFRSGSDTQAEVYVVYPDGTVEWQKTILSDTGGCERKVIHRYHNVSQEDVPVSSLCILTDKIISEKILNKK
ncbi:MAG: hypothetical protein J6B75_00580 [Ruminococcus sp.]|nr:hypothetical protein [Ruminococcus sp.]